MQIRNRTTVGTSRILYCTANLTFDGFEEIGCLRYLDAGWLVFSWTYLITPSDSAQPIRMLHSADSCSSYERPWEGHWLRLADLSAEVVAEHHFVVICISTQIRSAQIWSRFEAGTSCSCAQPVEPISLFQQSCIQVHPLKSKRRSVATVPSMALKTTLQESMHLHLSQARRHI